MTDKDAIQDAYEAKLAELYKSMFFAYLQAAGDAAQRAQADAHFKAGVALAREVRDKATTLL